MITCGPAGDLSDLVNWFIWVLLRGTRLRMTFEKIHLRTAASATHVQHDIPREKAAPLLWGSGDSRVSSTHWALWEVPVQSSPAPSQEQDNYSWKGWRSTKLWGQTEHLMSTADATGRLLPPVLWRLYVFTFWEKKNQHWKVLLASVSIKTGWQSPPSFIVVETKDSSAEISNVTKL